MKRSLIAPVHQDDRSDAQMVILIVEDVILIGWALKAVLLVGGHRALGPAQSADEALRIARAERPELAFVDINIAGNRMGSP